MQEIWKAIPGYEAMYEVSNFGRVKSLQRLRRAKGSGLSVVKERIRVPSKQREGYLSAHLSKEGVTKKHYVHRLVAQAFIENPDNLPQVNHLNGDKENNSQPNLEWCDGSGNCRHAVDQKIYLTARGEDAGSAKLTEESVIEIRRMASSGHLHREIAELFGVGRKNITKIVNRQRWAHVD